MLTSGIIQILPFQTFEAHIDKAHGEQAGQPKHSMAAPMIISGKCSRLRSTAMACLLLGAWTGTAVAQEEATRFSRNAIYVEVLGQGILYSVNYDHRFTPHIGLRAGFTTWVLDLVIIPEMRFTGFPIMINYLTGEGTSHLELGIGVIPMILSSPERENFLGLFHVEERTMTTVLATATVGYRAQPQDGGFVFRIGLTPFFTFKGAALSGGLSLGFAF